MKNDYCPLHSFIGSNNDINICKDYSDLVKGISCRVCQEHYDKRVHRGIVSTDEIVPKNECSLCRKKNETQSTNHRGI